MFLEGRIAANGSLLFVVLLVLLDSRQHSAARNAGAR